MAKQMMKLKIGYYEVEISARKSWNPNEGLDTKPFLNELSLFLWKAATQNASEGYDANAQAAKEMSDDIYMALKAVGYYDDVNLSEAIA